MVYGARTVVLTFLQQNALGFNEGRYRRELEGLIYTYITDQTSATI